MSTDMNTFYLPKGWPGPDELEDDGVGVLLDSWGY